MLRRHYNVFGYVGGNFVYFNLRLFHKNLFYVKDKDTFTNNLLDSISWKKKAKSFSTELIVKWSAKKDINVHFI